MKLRLYCLKFCNKQNTFVLIILWSKSTHEEGTIPLNFYQKNLFPFFFPCLLKPALFAQLPTNGLDVKHYNFYIDLK